MKNKKNLSIVLLLLAAVTFWHCEETKTTPDSRGDIVSANTLVSFNLSTLTQLAGSALDLPVELEMPHGVICVRIIYLTEDENGDIVEASGALFVPVNGTTFQPETSLFPILSIQHGTKAYADSVASVSPLSSAEGTLGLLIGMAGYITAVPDYLGMGFSDRIHPYIHAELTANAVVDMLRAVRHYCDDYGYQYNDKLFITGYSEGGYATLAAQKYIETYYSDEFQITASAPMAGPYDLSWTTRYVLQQETFNNPFYFGYLITAYNDVYKWNKLTTIFASPYGENMTGYFDGTHGGSWINSQLTYSVNELFKSDFISNYLSGNEPDIEAAIAENSLLDFTPQAPVLLIHGTADMDVPFENSVRADSVFTARGADVVFIPIPGANHYGGAMAGIPLAIAWIDSLYNLGH